MVRKVKVQVKQCHSLLIINRVTHVYIQQLFKEKHVEELENPEK